MTLLDWQRVHNEIIPTAVLSVDEVRERSTRNVLEVAYDGEVLVGCSTVRPPSEETDAVTVIARVLPPYRRRGFGTALYGTAWRRPTGSRGDAHPGEQRGRLKFAVAQGFTEVETYLLPGDTVPLCCCAAVRRYAEGPGWSRRR